MKKVFNFLMMSHRFLFLVFVLVISFVAEAASGEGGFPIKHIFYQVLNFTIAFSALIYFTRKPIKKLFQSRQDDFFRAEKEAKEREQKIQQEHQAWTQKVKEMDHKATTIKKEAEEEGARFQKSKDQEMNELQDKLGRDAEFLLGLEEKKLYTNMLKHFKSQIAEQAEGLLKKDQAFHKESSKRFTKEVARTKL